jgi:hypothetical protein
MANYIHVGSMIEELLEKDHRTKRDLGLDLGMSQGNVVYLTKRESIDVQMLHKIGNNLKYNFWKHFPIDDGKGPVAETAREKQLMDEKQKAMTELNAKIAEQEKVIADLKQQLVRQENDFLKEINGLLKRK